ncbi:JmjC domain-containing protein [Streptomyces palmae]|uniref:JmjC domain-containing protein n=1 Tax=Streptomyces palmae TaxID=1701085 RepID=UPI0014331BDD|nr:cupin domain-containing protein [Streptomyces palmae]
MQFRALARLVPSPKEFASAPPDRPAVWSMPAAPLTGLLDLDGIDRILRDGLPADRVRVVRRGENVPESEYTWGGRPIERPFSGDVRPGALSALLEEGSTVVLDALHRYWRPVGDFGRRLAHEVGLPVFATGFLTPPGRTGFPFHHDERGNFLIQTVGSKVWRVREPLLADPLTHETSATHSPTAEQLARFEREPATLETRLRPGDVLWIPRGWLHSGTATEEPSVHVTVGFVPMLTRYWLAGELVRLLASPDEEFTGFRRELPWGLHREPDRLAATVSEVLGELLAALPRLDARGLAEEVALSVRRSYPEPDRSPAAALGARVDEATRVVLVNESLFDAERLPDGRLRLRLSDTALTLGGPAADFVAERWERDDEQPWCAGDMPSAVGGAAAVSVVRTLLRAGVVRRSP